MKIIIGFFSIIIFLLSASPIFASTYYIAPDRDLDGSSPDIVGNDANPGTLSQPLKTFNQAWTFMKNDGTLGDTLVLMDGIYLQSFVPSLNGTSNPSIDTTDYLAYPLDHPERVKNYIKVQAQNDGKSIIDGENIRPTFRLNGQEANVGNYFFIEGLVVKNPYQGISSDNSKGTTILINSSNVVIKRTSAYNANTDENTGVFNVTPQFSNNPDNPANILIEDIVAAGSGRKMIMTYGNNVNVVFRRVFAAWQEWRSIDGAYYTPGEWPWGDGIETYNQGQADLANYPKLLGNSIFENSIIYGMLPTYGFSLTPNPDPGATRHNKYLGLIAIGGRMKWNGTEMKWPCPNPDNPSLDCQSQTQPSHGGGFVVGVYGAPQFNNNIFRDIFAYGNRNNGMAAGPWRAGSANNVLDHVTLTNNSLGSPPPSNGAGTELTSTTLTSFDETPNLYIEGNAQYADKSKGARLRYRYVNGVLTNQELWPWPMEDRIREEFKIHLSKYHSTNPELQNFSITNTIVPLINTYTAEQVFLGPTPTGPTRTPMPTPTVPSATPTLSPVPVIFTNITVSTNKTYPVMRLLPNTLMYIDRAFEFSSIPSGLSNHNALRTSNDDKFTPATSPHITFQLTQDAKVYVLYTTVGTTLASTWLTAANGWVDEPAMTVVSSLPGDESNRLVKSKSFGAGTTVTLNGNGSTDNTSSMYNVVVVPQGTSVTPSVSPTKPGDTDGDNDVDLTDLARLLGNFGSISSTGDTDGDGDVDLTDLTRLLGNFGT